MTGGKSRQHVACRSLETACCGPERSILQLLHNSSIPPRHNPLVWRGTVSMASTWVVVEAARAVKSSIPVNCPWGSTRSCYMANVHFRSPIGGPVSSLHIRVPPTGPRGPPSRGSSVQRGRGCPPGDLPWGSHAPVAWAPIHFRPLFAACFRASPRVRAGPNAAAVKDEGVGLSGRLSRAQHTVILLPGPRHAAVAASSSTSSVHVPGISHVIMLCT